jgi:predicted transposase/invertase (TIGR01784 family)
VTRFVFDGKRFFGDTIPIASLSDHVPEKPKETPDDKFSIVDVKATDQAGRRFTIEMQVRAEPHFTRRMMYYLSLLYANQLTAGKGYGELHVSYAIAILDDILFPEHDRFETHFTYRESALNLSLPDLPQLHFVELPKYADKPAGLRSRLEKWLHVLRFGEHYASGERELPDDIRAEEEMFMAIEEAKRVNADERLRAILEYRDKVEHDRITAEEAAERRGIEKVARAMIAQRCDPELISTCTGLPVDVIVDLRDQMGERPPSGQPT